MVYCGKGSTNGLSCFRKGIGVGVGLVRKNPKLNLGGKIGRGLTKEQKQADKDIKKFVEKTVRLAKKKEDDNKPVDLEKIAAIAEREMKKKQSPAKKETRGVKAGSKRGGYKKSEAVLKKQKQSAAKALKKALEKAEKTGKGETRGVKKGTKRGPYKKK